MNLHSFYTNKGLALAAKIAAGTAEMTVSRVVAGSGHTADIPSATDLPDQKQTLSVGLPTVSGATATLTVTLLEAQAASDYTLTELGLYALDPDEGEILFQVCQLTEAESITALGEGTLRFYLRQTFGAEGVTVTCSPAGIVLEEDIAELRAKAAYADHRNLLDNPWFTVNQRGQNSYTGNGYTVDRWKADNGGTSVSTSGVTLAPSVGVLHQYFEDDAWKLLGGRQVTLSIMTADGTVYSHTRSCPDYRVSVDADQRFFANGWRYQLYSTSSGLQVRILSGTSDVSIRAVKLELGSVSTLANDSAPNYAEELAKCQRYFARLINGSQQYNGRFFAGGTGTLLGTLSAPVPMRAVPVVTYSDIMAFDGTVGFVVNGLSHRTSHDAATEIGYTLMLNGVPSSNVTLFGSSDSPYLDISADL